MMLTASYSVRRRRLRIYFIWYSLYGPHGSVSTSAHLLRYDVTLSPGVQSEAAGAFFNNRRLGLIFVSGREIIRLVARNGGAHSIPIIMISLLTSGRSPGNSHQGSGLLPLSFNLFCAPSALG